MIVELLKVCIHSCDQTVKYSQISTSIEYGNGNSSILYLYGLSVRISV